MKNDKSLHGFAAMPEAERREIASRGGKRAHALGKAHEWTSQEASEAGKLGGQAVSQDREHMQRIGHAGGKAASKRKRDETEAES